ncbi:hypothetical protein AB0D27_11145 [Streptomyces sp. NPDC048415]|uniref:hypothetical protein n=1 Tax=Streptomyces sp. NPDC048415 TaxID=3154822 RepID=UPI003413F98E
MSQDYEDFALRMLEARGFKGIRADEWSQQRALDHLREQRRRYASDPGVQRKGRLGAILAQQLAEQTGVAAADIAAVLLNAGAKIASLVMLPGLDVPDVGEILQCAGDDLDRQARGGETS